jgi:hypothetical protein
VFMYADDFSGVEKTGVSIVEFFYQSYWRNKSIQRPTSGDG